MATVKTIMKVTHQEAVVKVAGTAAAETIDLQGDLFPYGTAVTGAGTVTIGLAATTVTGVDTAFTAAWVGAKIYTTAGVYVGTVATYTSDAKLALTANGAAAITGGAYKVAFRSQVLDGATQDVAIVGVSWSGAIGGIVTVTRNSVVIMTLQADAAGMMYFDGQTMPYENLHSTFDIVVTVSGAQAECWLKLRKLSGYKTTVEPEQFGPYDDVTVAGS